MALYEYVCRTCGGRFEVLQPMSAQPLRRCGEECVLDPPRGDGEVDRVPSVANVGRSSSSRAQQPASTPTCGRCGRTGPDVCG